jgi:Ulp1 family protease
VRGAGESLTWGVIEMKNKIAIQDNEIDCGVLVCMYAYALRSGVAVEKISPSKTKG